MLKKIRFYRFLLAVLVSNLSLPVHAYTCEGDVKGVTVNAQGQVMAESIGAAMQWPVFCNVSQIENGVAIAACRVVYASLLTAQATGRSVTVWVGGSAGSCGDLTPFNFVSGFGMVRINN